MQNLREQLLQAGLVTKDDCHKADQSDAKKNRARKAKPRAQPMAPSNARLKKDQQPRQPAARLVDLSDEAVLAIARAIETYRLREDTRGDVPFHFTMRDGRVRRLYVSKQVSGGLESGRLAIVENVESHRHIIVSAEAVGYIKEADASAVRFHNAL